MWPQITAGIPVTMKRQTGLNMPNTRLAMARVDFLGRVESVGGMALFMAFQRIRSGFVTFNTRMVLLEFQKATKFFSV